MTLFTATIKISIWTYDGRIHASVRFVGGFITPSFSAVPNAERDVAGSGEGKKMLLLLPPRTMSSYLTAATPFEAEPIVVCQWHTMASLFFHLLLSHIGGFGSWSEVYFYLPTLGLLNNISFGFGRGVRCG